MSRYVFSSHSNRSHTPFFWASSPSFIQVTNRLLRSDAGCLALSEKEEKRKKKKKDVVFVVVVFVFQSEANPLCPVAKHAWKWENGFSPFLPDADSIALRRGKKIPFSFFQHFSGVIYRGSVHKSHGRIKRAVVSSSVLLPSILSPIFGRGSPIYGNPILLSPEIKRGWFLKGQFINIIRIILIHMPIKGLILRVRFSPFSLRFLAT